MPTIDDRLLEPDDEMRITESFNRVMTKLDELDEVIKGLTEKANELTERLEVLEG